MRRGAAREGFIPNAISVGSASDTPDAGPKVRGGAGGAGTASGVPASSDWVGVGISSTGRGSVLGDSDGMLELNKREGYCDGRGI